MARTKKKQGNNGANLGFEAKLFLAADKLRGNLEPSEYKHVVLGLIFLNYISDAFEAKRVALIEDKYANPYDRRRHRDLPFCDAGNGIPRLGRVVCRWTEKP